MNEFYYRSPQNEDVELCKVLGPPDIRYAHGRSLETRNYDDAGQDYMTIYRTEKQVVFSICDGVGMSFFGDAAARFLGDKLLLFLKEESQSASAALNELLDKLTERLDLYTAEAHAYIQALPVPDHIHSLVASILEEKRVHGSETTFICGRIDMLPNDTCRLLLFWLGDSRFRLWVKGQEITVGPDAFRSERRWSSRAGCIGGTPSSLEIYARHEELQLLAYTDGLSDLDTCGEIPSDADVRRLFEQSLMKAASDDMTFLHIGWT